MMNDALSKHGNTNDLTITRATCQQSMHRHLGVCFLVHIMKVTRVPSSRPTFESLIPSRSTVKQSLKVTALYCGKQVVLGEFPILKNECLIDYQLVCQLNLSKPRVQSKLHFFIDQACSAGLAGHMALDLKEFICEGDTEVYLKYPLYAHASSHTQGPILKITIQRMDSGAENFIDDNSDFFVLHHKSVGMLHGNRFNGSRACYTLQSHVSGCCRSTCWDMSGSQTSAELAGTLSNLDESVRSFASTCTSNSYPENNGGVDTSLNSSSAMYQLSNTSKHLRTLSEFDCLPSSLECWQVPGYKRSISIDEVSSDFLCSHSSDEEHEHHYRCLNDCSTCSSNPCSDESTNLSLSSNCSVCSSQGLHPQRKAVSVSARPLLFQPDNASLERKEENKTLKPRKGLGFLRSLFGAVVVAGVSLLGAKNAGVSLLGAGKASMEKRERITNGGFPEGGQTAMFNHSVNSSRRRTLRNHYSPRFSV